MHLFICAIRALINGAQSWTGLPNGAMKRQLPAAISESKPYDALAQGAPPNRTRLS